MLIKIECGNYNCPGREEDQGYKFLGSEIPPSRIDPGHIEGSCPKCGEETFEWEHIERMSKEEIEELKYEYLI